MHALLVGAFLLLFGGLLAACGSDNQTEEQGQVFTVAIIRISPIFDQTVDGIKDYLSQRDFVEEENINYIEVDYSSEALAQAVDFSQVDIFVTIPGDYVLWQPVEELRDLSPDTPIVLVFSSLDIVDVGYADSLSQPAKNITGILPRDFDQKRFDLFLEIVPDAKIILLPYNPNDLSADGQIEALQTIAERADVELLLFEAPEGDIEVSIDAIADLPDDIDGIFLLRLWEASPLWVQAGYERRIPVSQEIVSPPGGMQPIMAYGPDRFELGAQAGRIIEQILHGIKAGDLPIENAQFYLTLDRGIAEAIDLDLPSSVLESANIVNDTDVSNIVNNAAGTEGLASVGACTASFTTPGGTSSICTTTACDSLTSNGFVSYNDKSDVDSCETETLVGLCSTDAFDTYFYDGDPASHRTGCSLASGTWTDGEN